MKFYELFLLFKGIECLMYGSYKLILESKQCQVFILNNFERVR